LAAFLRDPNHRVAKIPTELKPILMVQVGEGQQF
jgi:hypothetical protein